MICELRLLFILILLENVVTQEAVYEDIGDLCYWDPNESIQSRPLTRCEELRNVKVEKREFLDFIYWCVAVNNIYGKYTTLTVELNPPTEIFGTEQTVENFLRSLTYEMTLVNYKYNIEKELGNSFKNTYHIPIGRYTAYFKLPGGNFPINRIISLKIDGVESCNPLRVNESDPVFPNQQNLNQLRYYKKCIEYNTKRSEPEPNFCENLEEVNVRQLLLNNYIPFWCVNIDKNLIASKFGKKKFELSIEMQGFNNHLTYLDTANFVTYDDGRKYKFNVQDKIIVAIEPKNPDITITNITSIQVDGVESCGLVLHQSDCGEVKIKHRPFIALGFPTYPGEYPWHTAIYFIGDLEPKKYICGGSIIGVNAILTAAHCVSNERGHAQPNSLTAVVGKHDLRIRSFSSREYSVLKVLVHEQFELSYLEHDIAILKLKEYIQFNNFVQPICLTSNGQPFENKIGVVPGWGRNEANEQQNILSQASLPIISNDECRRSNRNFFHQFLSDGKFCAGYRNGSSVCTGDSGGGLVFKFPNRWYLRGIVSLGVSDQGFCDITEFVLFTDIVRYNNWIRSKLEV